MRKWIVCIAVAGSLCPVLAKAAKEDLPSIVSFGGTGQVIIRFDGRKKEAQVGTKLKYGSVIETGTTNSVTVAYPDGSLLAVHSGSLVEIQERSEGTQYNKLGFGEVHASVKKPLPGVPTPKKPRFIIRSRAAVLGVRGTEFVMGIDASGMNAQVHTLDGIVDVAQEEGKLLSGNATPVQSGHMVDVSEKGVNPPRPFDREQFLRDLKPERPRSADLSSESSAGGDSSVGSQSGPSGQSTPQESSLKPFAAPDRGNERDQDQKRDQTQNPRDQQSQDNRKPEEEGRKACIACFQAGVFFTQDMFFEPYNREPIRAFSLSWDPTFPIPLTKILAVRGHFGWNVAQDGSLNNKFLVSEFQVFGNVTLFRRFFGELGIGEQIWAHDGPDSGLFTANIGMAFADRGLIQRVFIGRSVLMTQPRVEEFKLGIGFSF